MTFTLASYLVTFAFGMATGWWATLRVGHRILDHQRGEQMPSHHHRRVPVILTVLIVSFMMLAGFGVQQTAYQRQAQHRDACYEKWGREMVDTVSLRSTVSASTDAAETARDDALDRIILTVIQFRSRPNASKTDAQKTFDAVLQEFARAKQRLIIAKQAQISARTENPYPMLHCN